MALITDLDDRTLVEHHHAGDEDAFRLIVERHHRSMYGNAMRRLHDSALAEDAVQEAFLRAFRALPKFNGDYHLDAWLHRILTNVCHDIGRRQGRDTRLFDRVSGEHDVAAPPADDLLESMPRQQLETALGSLPENYREVLLLRFVDELSYSDVAIKAGISEENARARVSRGRTMLRRLLEGSSAAIFWLIPPLRRNQLTGGETDVANHVASQHLPSAANLASPIVSQAAPAASQTTPALTQASNFVAQAVPSLVQAAPAVSHSAPAVGKAAVAVGLAASVAIPAGVAVEKRLDKPVPATAPPATDAGTAESPDDPVDVAAPTTSKAKSSGSVAAPTDQTTTTVEGVTSLGGGAVGATLDGSTTTSAPDTSTTTAPEGSTTTEPPTSSTAPPAAEEPSEPTEPGDETAEPTEPAPAPAPSGDLTSNVTVVDGPRLELDGGFTIDVDGQATTGTLTGKLLIGDPDPKNTEAPRQVDGELLLRLADGTTLDLRIKGQVSITSKGPRTFYDFAVMFRLAGGSAYGLAESGDLTGALETRDGSGDLHFVLPGDPSSDSSGT